MRSLIKAVLAHFAWNDVYQDAAWRYQQNALNNRRRALFVGIGSQFHSAGPDLFWLTRRAPKPNGPPADRPLYGWDHVQFDADGRIAP